MMAAKILNLQPRVRPRPHDDRLFPTELETAEIPRLLPLHIIREID